MGEALRQQNLVFSCFRRRFRINAEMFEFLTLDGAAAYYDAVMGLAEVYRQNLPLTVHEVRGEALVADFEGAARHGIRPSRISPPRSRERPEPPARARWLAASTRTGWVSGGCIERN